MNPAFGRALAEHPSRPGRILATKPSYLYLSYLGMGTSIRSPSYLRWRSIEAASVVQFKNRPLRQERSAQGETFRGRSVRKIKVCTRGMRTKPLTKFGHLKFIVVNF